MSLREDNHHLFQKNLRGSEVGRWVIAFYLGVVKGWDVTIPHTKVARTHDDWNRSKDNGDLIVRDDDETWIMEAKWLQYDWTSWRDWPHGRNYMVCAKHTFDNADPKPVRFYSVNRALTHIAWIDADTHDTWWVRRWKTNNYQDYCQVTYLADISLVKFKRLPWIKTNMFMR